MVNIYVGNLSYNTTEDQLRTMFEAHGTVDRANLATDRSTGRARGFGFVEMPNEAEARNAIGALNETELDGRKLMVNEAKPKVERSSSRRERY
jgi:cold-inducible RNA-binding protein